MTRKQNSHSQTNKMSDIGPEVRAWASHGEGEEIMLMFSNIACFFLAEGAMDVFTRTEIATLKKNIITALGLAWFAHTKKHVDKKDAFELAVKFYGERMHALIMNMPSSRRDAAADFVEADGCWKVVNAPEGIDQMD